MHAGASHVWGLHAPGRKSAPDCKKYKLQQVSLDILACLAYKPCAYWGMAKRPADFEKHQTNASGSLRQCMAQNHLQDATAHSTTEHGKWALRGLHLLAAPVAASLPPDAARAAAALSVWYTPRSQQPACMAAPQTLCTSSVASFSW